MPAEFAAAVPAGSVTLQGTVALPDPVCGIVVFAHGSGSSRHSPRNRFVAEMLRVRGIGTLLADLLSADEEAVDRRTRELRFDITLLADRLVALLDWLRADPRTGGLPAAVFGASTGGGAALLAAANRPDLVAAVVSRGGRPDLAGQGPLAAVRAPTLLVVGAADPIVRELNESALALLGGPKELVVVPAAGHLFEEPGALERVAELAGEWFLRWLRPEGG